MRPERFRRLREDRRRVGTDESPVSAGDLGFELPCSPSAVAGKDTEVSGFLAVLEKSAQGFCAAAPVDAFQDAFRILDRRSAPNEEREAIDGHWPSEEHDVSRAVEVSEGRHDLSERRAGRLVDDEARRSLPLVIEEQHDRLVKTWVGKMRLRNEEDPGFQRECPLPPLCSCRRRNPGRHGDEGQKGDAANAGLPSGRSAIRHPYPHITRGRRAEGGGCS